MRHEFHPHIVRQRASQPAAAAATMPAFDIEAQTLRLLAGSIRNVLDSELPRAQQVEMLSRMMCRMSAAMYSDTLTSVRNRRGFLRDGALILANCAAQGGRAFVIYMDVDNLKAVNDAGGHAAGDALLRHAASALQATFRSGDVIGRLGGDEFAAVAPARHPDTVRVLLGRLRRELARVNAGRDCWPVALSVGVSSFEPAEPRTLEQLLAIADGGMYESKCAGRAG